MTRNIHQELSQFEQHIHDIAKIYNYKEVCPWAGVILPKTEQASSKKIPLTVMGITHGNEVGGLGAINDFLSLLKDSWISLPFPIGIALGNVAAAKEGRRFLENDLNRSFAATNVDSLEAKRALQLSELLKDSAYFIDFHQTNLSSESPFFIFPYQKNAFAFAASVSAFLPVVTHWGSGGYSVEGQCSDEYVNSKGGTGITVELGQCGFQPWHCGLGTQLILNAINQVNKLLQGASLPSINAYKGTLFTMAHIFKLSGKEKEANLLPGWTNFQSITKGQLLGHIDGVPQFSPTGGKLLFPVYPNPHIPDKPGPYEWVRVLREAALSELPGD